MADRPTRSERIQLRATAETRAQLDALAAENDLSIADVVARLVREETRRRAKAGAVGGPRRKAGA